MSRQTSGPFVKRKTIEEKRRKERTLLSLWREVAESHLWIKMEEAARGVIS